VVLTLLTLKKEKSCPEGNFFLTSNLNAKIKKSRGLHTVQPIGLDSPFHCICNEQRNIYP